MATKDKKATQAVFPCRFSYLSVFEKRAVQEGQDEKYSASILIDKKDKATIALVKAAIEAAKQEGLTKLGGKVPPNLKSPLRDGDTERPDDDNYKGHYFINASSKTKPQVVGTEKDPETGKLMVIADPMEFYSGCYGRVSINFYAYNQKGNRGIAAGLNNCQKTKDGERLGGRSSASDDFGGEDNEEL